VRIVVNFDLCESNALCVAEAPEVFFVGDDDQLSVLEEFPADGQRTSVRAAARVCPKQAITIED
jgi:ferredoxin